MAGNVGKVLKTRGLSKWHTCHSLTETKCAFLGAGPSRLGCCCPDAAPEAWNKETRVRGERGGPGRHNKAQWAHGYAELDSSFETALHREDCCSPDSSPGSHAATPSTTVQRRETSMPDALRGAQWWVQGTHGLYLVPAHQEEVHSSPVDAVSLTESSQDLFDGEPCLDGHSAGCPVREVHTTVLGSLVSLRCRGPAGFCLGTGKQASQSQV